MKFSLITGLMAATGMIFVGCGGNNNRTVFYESFENGNWDNRITFTRINDMSAAVTAGAFQGKCLVIKPGLETRTNSCALVIPNIPVCPGAIYSVSLFYRLAAQDAGATARKANLPSGPSLSLRIIPVSGKYKYPPRKYIWADCKPEHTGQWRDLRRIFSLPTDAESMNLTVFMAGSGKHEVDDIKVEEIK